MPTGQLDHVLQHLRQAVGLSDAQCLTDAQLLERYVSSKDQVAFAALVCRYGRLVRSVCRHVLCQESDIDDAFQATFLVFVSKAASIRKSSSVASWLYGVAYRSAMKVKRAAARRYEKQRETKGYAREQPVTEATLREIQAILDEEVQGLPEKHRAPFILCCLEGKSRDEAAQLLGLKEGTLSSRLAQARQHLQQRLTRRGVLLSAALCAAELSRTTAAASVPPTLLKSTINGALSFAGGKAAAAPLVSAEVAGLAQGVLHSMSSTTFKIATTTLLAATLLAGASAWTYRGWLASVLAPSAQPVEPPVAEPTEPRPWPAAFVQGTIKDHIALPGYVLAPDGTPKGGAKLLLLDGNDNVKPVGISATDGRFIVPVPSKMKDPFLIAQADGNGIALMRLALITPEKSVELRLVKDNPIRGRVVNTEGKPIAGVRVAVKSLNVYANNSLDTFLQAWKEKHIFLSGRLGVKGLRSEAAGVWSATATPGLLLATMTDADGLFTLHGAGTERVALLRLSGAGIADKEVWIVNREGFDAKSYNAELQNIPKGRSDYEIARVRAKRLELHGPTGSVLAEPEKLVRGIVTDAESGKGRPNVLVRLNIHASQEREGVVLEGRYPLAVPVQTRTDAEGRYELHGALKGESYLLDVPSDPSTGHMACQVRAEDTPGYQPITANIRVKKGVIVTGKMIERTSGKPVPGFATVRVLINNSFAKDYPGLNLGKPLEVLEKQETSAEGAYRIVTIPGSVLLMGGPTEAAASKKYQPPSPDPKYPQYFNEKLRFYYHLDQSIRMLEGNFCKVLEIKPGVAVVTQDIILERRQP